MTTPITPAQRKEVIKAGKRERIAKMLAKMYPQQPVIDEQLMMLLGRKKETR
jgi:hypothetical protein